MGGTVSLSVAVQYPSRANKVTVVGSPIVGSSLSFLLKLFGRKLIAYVVYNNMWAFRLFYRALAPFYSKDKRWPEMMERDLSKTTLESFLYSIASLRRTDLRPYMNQLRIPIMGMYGDKDIVVHPAQWKLILDGVPNARIERFPRAGHFIMLDEPQRFSETLKSFLDQEVF